MPDPSPPDAPGVVTKVSPSPVADTCARLAAAVHTKGLTVFARIDHHAGSVGVGLDMREAQVLIFGSPRAGTPLMVAAPLAALDLPLRVLVWQDANARVWVSYQNVSSLAERYGIPTDLVPNIAGIDALVDAALQD